MMIDKKMDCHKAHENTFLMSLDKIQPSQLYISREKLSRVMEAFESEKTDSPEPIPVKELNGEIILTDGHKRALALFLKGFSEVEVEWEDTELDWEAYSICVAWCKEEGIRRIVDLRNRVIDQSDYQILWLERCRAMHEELATKKSQV